MGGILGQLNRLVKDVSQRTSDALSKQQAALVRGKVSGKQVFDDEGTLLVDAGHIIDDSVIQHASDAGKLSQLVMAAGAARVQDFREAAQDKIDRTGGGQEARYLDSVEEYGAARGYIGKYAGVDVTDVRGNVVIPTGKKINEDDVRIAREAGLLSALVFAAQQPYTPPEPEPEPARARGPFESDEDEAFTSEIAGADEASPVPRRRIALMDPSSASLSEPAKD
jgi:hypothetical protein